MRRLGLRAMAVAVVVGGALVLPRPAAGHALLIASDPKAGSTLTTTPAVVTLTFGEAPDLGLSTVRILDSGGNDQAAGPIEAVPGKPDQVRVQVKPLPDGVYTVAWRTVSTVDGHVAAGSFAFGVGLPPPPTTGGEPTVSSPGASVAATIARWLLYLGLVALFGAGFLGFAIEPRARAIVWMAVAGWSVGLVGTLAVIGVQWSDSGVDLGAMLRSSIGLGAFERVGVMVAAALPVAALWPRRTSPPWLLGLAAAGAAAAMLVDVLNGHAANGEAWLLQIGVQWLHVVGVGIWIGGLAALLLAVRGAPSAEKARAVHTFSTWAGVALAAVAATGFLRALSEVQTIEALFTTDFGVVVILKTVGLGILALLGATNRFFNVPAAVRTLRGLRRVGSTELVIGTAVLVATGFLVNLAPPSAGGGSQEAAAPRPVAATGSDFGTSVRVRLVVEPGTAGFNDFTAEATDYDSGAAIVADRVQLRFALASRSGVGGSTLELTPQPEGGYAAHGGNLALDGIWRVTATLDGPNGSVEVPLVVSTQVAEQAVDVVAGAPSIYTVHVSDSSSVQVYVDPGSAGPNELHITFFDAAGAELPVPATTAAMSPEDGAASLLTPRLLEPGHFVADMELSTGTIGVDIVGGAPGAAPIHVHLDIVVGA